MTSPRACRRTASRPSSSSATAAATRRARRPWPRSSPRSGPARPLALHIGEYYTYNVVTKHFEDQGAAAQGSQELDGMHDDPVITLNMFIDDPNSVRYDARVKAGKASIDGVSIADRAKATDLAKKIVAFRADYTVAAINKAIAAKGKATMRSSSRAIQAVSTRPRPSVHAATGPAPAAPPSRRSQDLSRPLRGAAAVSGATIGPYRVLRELGQGGMGTVRARRRHAPRPPGGAEDRVGRRRPAPPTAAQQLLAEARAAAAHQPSRHRRRARRHRSTTATWPSSSSSWTAKRWRRGWPTARCPKGRPSTSRCRSPTRSSVAHGQRAPPRFEAVQRDARGGRRGQDPRLRHRPAGRGEPAPTTRATLVPGHPRLRGAGAVGRPSGRRARRLYALGWSCSEMLSGKRPFPEREPFRWPAPHSIGSRGGCRRWFPGWRPALNRLVAPGSLAAHPTLRPPKARAVADAAAAAGATRASRPVSGHGGLERPPRRWRAPQVAGRTGHRARCLSPPASR